MTIAFPQRNYINWSTLVSDLDRMISVQSAAFDDANKTWLQTSSNNTIPFAAQANCGLSFSYLLEKLDSCFVVFFLFLEHRFFPCFLMSLSYAKNCGYFNKIVLKCEPQWMKKWPENQQLDVYNVDELSFRLREGNVTARNVLSSLRLTWQYTATEKKDQKILKCIGVTFVSRKEHLCARR